MHDPDGVMFPHLRKITPHLKDLFSQVFVSVTWITRQRFPEYVSWLDSDGFFHVTKLKVDLPVGEEFLILYANAAESCRPDQVLHLCFIDRVSFALEGDYREAFSADIQALDPNDTPLIYQRSELAWETHPDNYRAIEGMATTVGEFLFGKSLDFAWCHLAIRAERLLKIIPTVKNRDISCIAEIVIAVRKEVKTREVDWLAWEDPFLAS
jgi:hypothetical protein